MNNYVDVEMNVKKKKKIFFRQSAKNVQENLNENIKSFRNTDSVALICHKNAIICIISC